MYMATTNGTARAGLSIGPIMIRMVLMKMAGSFLMGKNISRKFILDLCIRPDWVYRDIQPDFFLSDPWSVFSLYYYLISRVSLNIQLSSENSLPAAAKNEFLEVPSIPLP